MQDNIAAADGLLPAPDVTLNVANVRLAQQDYYSAIQLYQACLRRHHQNKDATVLLYLARYATLLESPHAMTWSQTPTPLWKHNMTATCLDLVQVTLLCRLTASISRL